MLIFDFSESFNPQPLSFEHPEAVLVAHSLDAVLPALAEVEAATRRGLYAAGYIGYEAAPAFDAALSAYPPARDGESPPLLWFGLYRAPQPAPPTAGLAMYHLSDWQGEVSPDRYTAAIAAIRQAIRDGEIYQANFTQQLQAAFSGDTLAWFEDLQRGAHGRFNAYLDIGRHRLLSLSPELFFRWDGQHITTRPMKGTARRLPPPATGREAWEAADRALADGLLASAKNRAENLMIVDLLRNDLSRVAMPGSVKVPQLFSLEAYPTVYQLTSTVTAETRPDIGLVEVFQALFPCGSITGAPKIRASEIIATLENSPRGPYCGAVGYVAPGGRAVFNVAIRTIVVDRETGRATCGVGGGVVWDSTSEGEYDEALAKAAFISHSSQGYQLLETLRLANGTYDWQAEHLARLMRSAAMLGFAANIGAIEQALAEHANLHPQTTRRVRLLLARDGGIAISSEGLEVAPPSWLGPSLDAPRPVAFCPLPVRHDDYALPHKTTRRAVYEARRRRYADVFDVLLCNERGELTEFTTGNLLLVLDGQWYTPPLSCGLLAGVLREALLARRLIHERVLHEADLARAEGLAFINSVRGWVRVELLKAGGLDH
ncbi:MAG: aminodeoxychorismate synthase component I [Betaproteobacteria bacterium]|nr:aminodeoxychorismate synthase component I [Betaproteobacteria bacterium]